MTEQFEPGPAVPAERSELRFARWLRFLKLCFSLLFIIIAARLVSIQLIY